MNSMQGGHTGYSSRRGTGDIIPKGYESGQLQQFTPEQMRLFKQLFSQISPDSYLSRLAGGDESLFEEMEAPALRQFNSLQGNIASRFSGMGMGSRNSSGFQNTINQAGSDFAQDLASRRQGLQRQAIMDMMGISQNLLSQRPYERFLEQKPEKQEGSGWGPLAGGVIGGIGGSFFGNPLLGAQLGAAAGSYF